MYSIHQKGFSLIEVMIAAGLSTLIALGFVTLFSDSARQTIILRQRLDRTDTERYTITVLSNPVAPLCKNNFIHLGVAFNPALAPGAIQPDIAIANLFDSFDATGAPAAGVAPFLQAGALTNTNLTVTAIKLTQFTRAAPGVNSYNGKLEIDYAASYGPPLMPTVIPLTLNTTAAGTVSGCGTVGGTGSGGLLGGLTQRTFDIPANGVTVFIGDWNFCVNSGNLHAGALGGTQQITTGPQNPDGTYPFSAINIPDPDYNTPIWAVTCYISGPSITGVWSGAHGGPGGGACPAVGSNCAPIGSTYNCTDVPWGGGGGMGGGGGPGVKMIFSCN